jgi:hypothetical protein
MKDKNMAVLGIGTAQALVFFLLNSINMKTQFRKSSVLIECMKNRNMYIFPLTLAHMKLCGIHYGSPRITFYQRYLLR